MDNIPSHFKCLVVEKNNNEVVCDLKTRELDPLDDGEVRIRVTHSSLNYKDGLALTGHPGVAKSLPLVPGIDASGMVIESRSQEFQPGQKVMIFHAKFGTECDGGYREIATVPADWVYPIPASLNEESVMVIGTAGFTAAQCVDQLMRHGIGPDAGEVVVTGATGGVGVFSVKLLSKLGYSVVASTGKLDRSDWLKQLGANEVIPRDQLNDDSDKPLLKSRWAGAIDTVGSNTLGTVLRSTKWGGCVSACGLAGGFDLPVSVYPFILRGVTLQGVDTAHIPREYRSQIWNRIAGPWCFEELDELKEIVSMNGLPEKVKQILAGKVAGRTVIKID